MIPEDPQDRAYEGAVRAIWADPAMDEVVRSSFLHEDLEEALAAFLASEHWARVRRLLDECGVKPGSRVLDFGGGRGMISAALATEGFSATLCEPNPSEIVGTGAAQDFSELVPGGFEVVNGPVEALASEGPVRGGRLPSRAAPHPPAGPSHATARLRHIPRRGLHRQRRADDSRGGGAGGGFARASLRPVRGRGVGWDAGHVSRCPAEGRLRARRVQISGVVAGLPAHSPPRPGGPSRDRGLRLVQA